MTNPPSAGKCSAGIVRDVAHEGLVDLDEVFWYNIDPLISNAQFCDHGNQYRSAIFYHDDEEKRLADASKLVFSQSGRFKAPIVTEGLLHGRGIPPGLLPDESGALRVL